MTPAAASSAQPLTPAEADRLAAMEAAPYAPEALRERVARALMTGPAHAPWRSSRLFGDAGGFYGLDRDSAERLADAAIAVLTEDARA